MKTKSYIIKYHFGQYDTLIRESVRTYDAACTLNQVASIFATIMDCRNLVIDEIVAL